LYTTGKIRRRDAAFGDASQGRAGDDLEKTDVIAEAEEKIGAAVRRPVAALKTAADPPGRCSQSETVGVRL